MGRHPGVRKHFCAKCGKSSFTTIDGEPLDAAASRILLVFARIPEQHREAALEAAWLACADSTRDELIANDIPTEQADGVRDELRALWPLTEAKRDGLIR